MPKISKTRDVIEASAAQVRKLKKSRTLRVRGPNGKFSHKLTIDGVVYDIVDGTTDINLRFAASDVTNAVTFSSTHCVIALACKRALSVPKIYVENSVVYLQETSRNVYVRYLLNSAGIRLVRDFDSKRGDFNLSNIRLIAPTGQKLLGSPHPRHKGAGIPRRPRRKFLIEGPHRERPIIKRLSLDTPTASRTRARSVTAQPESS